MLYIFVEYRKRACILNRSPHQRLMFCMYLEGWSRMNIHLLANLSNNVHVYTNKDMVSSSSFVPQGRFEVLPVCQVHRVLRDLHPA